MEAVRRNNQRKWGCRPAERDWRRWKWTSLMASAIMIWSIQWVPAAEGDLRPAPGGIGPGIRAGDRISSPAPSGEKKEVTAETERGGAEVVAASYRLTENDVVSVTVYQEPDLETRAKIGRDGTIQFPLLGTVRLGGKTIREAAGELRERLAEDFLVDPQVSVTLVEYSKRQFTILGEVQRPGTYPLPDDRPLTLQQAIGVAGGFTRRAKQNRITITRVAGRNKEVQRVDAAAFARDEHSKAAIVLPDDHIVVPEKFW